MENFQKALHIMEELFSKDCIFALATLNGCRPSVRMTDAYYYEESFYVVTHRNSLKVKNIQENNYVSLCCQANRLECLARVAGHPLIPENSGIREKLINVFEAWYFRHNNESDPDMCYVEIKPVNGFIHKDGTGYKIDFIEETVASFPFVFDAVIPS